MLKRDEASMYAVGLFVGLSGQFDPRIETLRHGHRDAEALRAIFADANTFRGDSSTPLTLITNELATRERVSLALQELVAEVNALHPEIVFVHFSCHGGPSGELALYDCVLGEVAKTALPVSEVVHALSKIRGSQVILSLDCCFAGAVLGMPESPNRDALKALLGDLGGEGNFVVWAAEPGQKAWEDVEYAHGYLTHSLIQGLANLRSSGATAVATAQWLTTACKNVEALAARHGHIQTAGCLARVTSKAVVFVPPVGEHQRMFSRDYGVLPVTEDIDSLQVYGFADSTCEAVRARIGTGSDARLNQLQRDAVSPGGLLAGQSLMVRAPTSAGKTLIGELAMLRHWPVGRKTAVLLPMKAMVQEQGATLRSFYEGLGLRIVVSTGDAAEDDDFLLTKQFDVALLTYEKFYAILSIRPELIADLGLIVFDEVQLIEDESRGQTVELLLMRAKQLQGAGRYPQILVLCGELADLDHLQEWLNLHPVGVAARPIPLHEGVVGPDGIAQLVDRESRKRESIRISGLPSKSRADRQIRKETDIRANAAVTIAQSFIVDGNQVLLFCQTRWEVFRLAEWLATDLNLPAVQLQISASNVDETRAGTLLRRLLRSGVGFHLADLDRDERREVEASFRRRELRILVATSTLAMGVNLPADVTLIVGADVWRPEGNVPLAVPVYRNMAGRAGRLLPNGPTKGIALLVAASKQEEAVLWNRYIEAPPPSLKSTFGQRDVAERTLGLLRQRSSASPVDLAGDLARTFWGFGEDGGPKWVTARRRETEAALEELSARGLAIQSTVGRWDLTSLGDVAAGFGLRISSISAVRAVVEAAIAAGLAIDVVVLLFCTQVMSELDEVSMPKSPSASLSVPKCPPTLKKYSGLWALMTASQGPTGCSVETASNRAHRVVALLQWRSGKSLPELETLLDRRGEGQPVSGPFRSIVERTIDMLPAVAAIVSRIAPEQSHGLRSVLTSAKNQLSVGGDADAGELFGLRLGLSRDECRRLRALGVNANSLGRDVEERRLDLVQALGEKRFDVLVAKLSDVRHTRRRSGVSDQLLLDDLGEVAGF